MYQIARNFTLRLILSFTICASLLLLPGVSLLSEASPGQGQEAADNARPRHKRPEGILPDLEDVKRESNVVREAPPPIPSTVRAKRNEGKPWDGRRVGDPGTQRPLDEPEVERQTRRAHARRRVAPPPLYEDQFIQNFFSVALLRSPTGDEPLYWNYLLRAGYNQSQTSLKLAAIELGRTLFESASYLTRNRGAHDYVHDLYNAYLMREPDAGGWAYWEALVSSNGREYVRRGFEESGEFATLLGDDLTERFGRHERFLVDNSARGSAQSAWQRHALAGCKLECVLAQFAGPQWTRSRPRAFLFLDGLDVFQAIFLL